MVNRQGLLDMYHQQVHGRGDLVCSKDGPKSYYKEKRADGTLNRRSELTAFYSYVN